MPATPLAATSRYVPISFRHIYWLPAIATLASPTRAELNAGTDLTGQIPDDGVNGWTVTAEFVPAPDFAGGLTPSVPKNVLTPDTCSLDFYMSSTSADVRTLLTRGLNGFIVMLWEGDIAGRKMTPFQVTVAAQQPKPDGGNPARIGIQFGVFAFSEMVTVPA